MQIKLAGEKAEPDCRLARKKTDSRNADAKISIISRDSIAGAAFSSEGSHQTHEALSLLEYSFLPESLNH